MSTVQPVTGNTGHTKSENRVVYPALDGLRTLAFFMVFLQHYMFVQWGTCGVNLFFVLSGFLITGILWDTRDSPYRARNFYIRRTLRIFPLYYGVFLVLLLTTPLFHWQWSIYWSAWPLYLGNFLRFLSPSSAQPHSILQIASDGVLLMHSLSSKMYVSIAPFWSLCVEEQFYLLWPWVVFSVWSRRTLLWICTFVVVILPFIRFFLQFHLPPWMDQQDIFYRLTPFELDSLLLGALIALIWRGAHRQTMLALGQKIAPLFLVACAAAYIWRDLHSPDPFEGFLYPSWHWTFGLTLTNFISAALLLSALNPGTWIYRFLSLRWMRWVGRISYGAYVFHDMCDIMAHQAMASLFPEFVHGHRFASRLIVAVPILILTLVTAFLSFRFFESPFLKLKEKLTR